LFKTQEEPSSQCVLKKDRKAEFVLEQLIPALILVRFFTAALALCWVSNTFSSDSRGSRTSPCVIRPTTHEGLALWGYSSSPVLPKQILCHANTLYCPCSPILPVPQPCWQLFGLHPKVRVRVPSLPYQHLSILCLASSGA